ncbi:MAG: kinase [Duodenibacillus sp.]|nr:kinase [Duodenibacillus sp.]
MADDIIELTAEDGSPVRFVRTDEPMAGTMKQVFFSPDKSYVVAFFNKQPDASSMDRLEKLTGQYRESIFRGDQAAYWEKYFCWPTKIVRWEGRVGLVCPAYAPDYYFAGGPFKGKEKEGKWFASAKLLNRHMPPEQRGDWLHRLVMCLKIARAVRRMHAAGLSHSDLSYKNVLVDPVQGRATVIDIDGLVVPGKYHPDVVGTPDFIAPEVQETGDLPKSDPRKRLPSKETDLHALAVLIYMYLLNRHPLRGGKVNDENDSEADEALSMGKCALFIEHPYDKSNRPDLKQVDPDCLPQADVQKLPYGLCGPHLKALFDQAFVDGLHEPRMRPSAQQWEDGLLATLDMMLPCANDACPSKWFVFDNKMRPRCPFCGTPYSGLLPVLDFYYSPRDDGEYSAERKSLMIYDRQNLYLWNINRLVVPNERLKPGEDEPVADFWLHGGKWYLINRGMSDLCEILPGKARRRVPEGTKVELRDGQMLVLSSQPGGRLAYVSLANR